MAVSAPSILVTPSSTLDNSQVKTSAAFRPTANALVQVVVSVMGNASANSPVAASAITSTISGMGPWSLLQKAGAANATSAVFVFYATAGASPNTGTVTVTLVGSPNDGKLGVFEQTGHDATNPIVGTADAFSSTTTASVTLTQAPTAGDYVNGIATARNNITAATAGTGFTMLWSVANTSTPSAATSMEYRTGSTRTSADINGLWTVHNSFIAYIVKAAPAASLTWTRWNGTTEVPLTVQGVWNGTLVAPPVAITRI